MMTMPMTMISRQFSIMISGGEKMSYVCQECGSEYGDPSLDEIPIVCSECVGGSDVEPEEEDDDDSGELFG